MPSQLFIYYRISKSEIAIGMACAKQLMKTLEDQSLATANLFQRDEVYKPYFTLMEIIHPAAAQADNITQFSALVEKLAKDCFSCLSKPPNRHVEVFTPVTNDILGPRFV